MAKKLILITNHCKLLQQKDRKLEAVSNLIFSKLQGISWDLICAVINILCLF